jgi:hypothetical protein
MRRKVGWLLAIVLVPLLAAPAVRAQSSEPASLPGDDREPISARRIIKHFDFNERSLQNAGTVPLNWRPLRMAGFPRYLEGKFDEKVGRSSPPSFRLDLDGGSVAYAYEGNDIAVRSNSDYLVVAWVKTAGLVNARAYLTAYFLDRKGNRIPGTEQTTSFVGGTGKTTGFEPIQVGLIGDVEGARYIGLTVWLTQSSVWDRRPQAPHNIQRDDVTATAWFDDLTVYRLPRVALSSSSPGNVFVVGEPVVLHPDVTDPDGLNLIARLTVDMIDGSFHDERNVPVRSGTASSEPVVYETLPVGFYNVRLEATTHGVPLVWRTLSLARIPEPFSSPQSIGRGFGAVLRDTDPAARNGQRALLSYVRPELVKLPVWYTQQAILGQNYEVTRAVDGYLQAILETGGNPVGIQMDNVARSTQSRENALRTMIDLLSEQPIAWKPLIAGTWSRYTGLIHVWQVGQDGDDALYLDHRLGRLLSTLRREMASLMSEPMLASPVSTRYPPGTGPVADFRCIDVPVSVAPRDIEQHLRPLLGTDRSRAWITLECLDDRAYPRQMRLVDYARRLAATYFIDPGAVFVPAPWESQIEMVTAQVNPREEYLVLRTIADVLGGTIPVSRTNIGGHAECLMFDRHGQAVLFVWDDYAPPEGREHTLYLGDYAEQIDLWGRRTKLQTVGTAQKVRIGPVPSFIVNTPTWIMEFRRNFVVTPPLLEANFSAGEQAIEFKNTYHEPISGIVRIVSPENWDVRPTRATFALQPGQTFRQPLEIRFPINAEAGVEALLGEFSLDGDRRYQFTVPAWFELGLNGIDLDTYVFRRSSEAIVRVSMTNHTKQAVSFDGDLIVPGRQRASRLFQNILPGQSISKEFSIDNADQLVGRQVRVHFNERSGTRVWNRLLTIP